MSFRGGHRFLSVLILSAAALACTSPPVIVSLPVPPAVTKQSFTLQVTGKRTLLGPVSPNGRYAKLLQTRLSNRLIDAGYVLQTENGMTHIHVSVERVTTGGTANRADCELHVTAYDGYPGDLRASKGKVTASGLHKVFEFEVRVSKKVRNQGYSKEGLADEAATEAVELILMQLEKAKAQQ